MNLLSTEWINRTSMTSLRSVAIIVAFLFVVFVFTLTAVVMFLGGDAAEAGRLAAGMIKADTSHAVHEAAQAFRASAQTTETSRHGYGMQITNALFLLITAAIVGNVAGQGIDRFSSREHGETRAKIAEAKEKGRESARMAKNGNTERKTQEHPVPDPLPESAPTQQVNVTVGSE